MSRRYYNHEDDYNNYGYGTGHEGRAKFALFAVTLILIGSVLYALFQWLFH